MHITIEPYKYLKEGFNIEDWNQVRASLEELEAENINSMEQLEHFIAHYNELLDEIHNKDTQNYVKLSLDTGNKELNRKQSEYFEMIITNSKPYSFNIEKKIYESNYLSKLSERYDNYRKIIERNIKCYSDTNLALFEEEQSLCLKYRKAISNIALCYEDEEKTISQMQKILKEASSDKRERIWKQIMSSWIDNKELLDNTFSQILSIRNQISKNSGYTDYTEYMSKIRNRFEYGVDDLKLLHNSVEEIVVPALRKINGIRKTKLSVKSLFPWDADNNIDSNLLIPFRTIDDLISKTYKVLEKINPRFAVAFKKMVDTGNIDLGVRKGKTPGGFCFPIDRSGMCFICMNVTGSSVEANILVHEAGHGIHSLAHSDEIVREYRMFDGPGELAEFPPKTMELLAMDYYDEYYDSIENIKQARKERLIDILVSLRRYIVIDSLEQWLYSNPEHTVQERSKFVSSLEDRFNIGIDWTGLDEEKSVWWYKEQLMIIQPLYVISYAIAQLGALDVYRNYRQNREKTIASFEASLKLGFSRSIGEIYEAAGGKLDFSKEYIRKLVDFILEEIEILE